MGERATVTLAIMAMMCATSLVIALGYFWHKRPRSVSNKTLEEIAERLAQLERAVDAIAVETERISEGQRFTTKLLSERSAEHGVPR